MSIPAPFGDLFPSAEEPNFQTAKELKEQGIKYFKQGELMPAINEWDRAFEYIDMADSAAQEFRDLRLALQLNIAAARLKLVDCPKTAHDRMGCMYAQQNCEEALLLDPKSVKAWFRLGQALRGQGEFKGALTSFMKAAQFDKEHTGVVGPDIRQAIQEVRDKEATLNPKPKAALSTSTPEDEGMNAGDQSQSQDDLLRHFIKIGSNPTPEQRQLLMKNPEMAKFLDPSYRAECARDLIQTDDGSESRQFASTEAIDCLPPCPPEEVERSMGLCGKLSVAFVDFLRARDGKVLAKNQALAAKGKPVKNNYPGEVAMEMMAAGDLAYFDVMEDLWSYSWSAEALHDMCFTQARLISQVVPRRAQPGATGPGLRVLEYGAGEGMLSSYLAAMVGRPGGVAVEQWTPTDVDTDDSASEAVSTFAVTALRRPGGHAPVRFQRLYQEAETGSM